MDQNYNWSNPTFKNRAGEFLNLSVNTIADVLHTLATESTTEPTPPEPIPLWAIGVAIIPVTLATIGLVTYSKRKR